MKCEKCGNEIDEFEQENIEVSHPHLSGHYCESCIDDAINFGESGIVYEHCETCGKKFDYAEDSYNFTKEVEGRFNISDVEIDIVGGFHCLDCALEKFKNEKDDIFNF